MATLYKEGVTDAIAVIEGMPPHDRNELIREKGSGTYYFTVKTVSLDGTAESKTVTSPKKYIDVDKIPQIAVPTNLRWKGTRAEWDAVEGATKYYFELFRDGSRVMTGDGSNTYEECGFLFDEDDLGTGVYTFRVTALAQENGVTLAQAASEMSGKYIALDAPQNIAWDGMVARWGSVKNATGYQVYLDCPGELPTRISNVSDTQKDMKEYFTEAGDYTFYVYAYAEVEGYGGQMLGRVSATSAGYAYDPEAYTVTFDANGGTGYMANVHVSGDYTLPASPFTAPSGYKFSGWATSADGSVITGTSIAVSADTTLYAIWELNSYTVTYMIDGQTVSTQTVRHGKDATAPTIPEKEGYTSKWDKDGKNITADTVINAVYTANGYKITLIYPTYDREILVNHGMSFNEMYTDIDANVNLAAEKDYHTFIGWYESTDGGETLKDTPYDFNTKVTGDVTLYPLFEKNTYTVEATCDSLWGTVTGGGSYEEGATVTLTATPVDGTKFEYWLDSSVQLSDEPTEAELRAAIVSYEASYTFTAEKNVSLEAVFSLSGGIGITPMLIAGTDEIDLLEAERMDVEYDFGTIIPGAEQIVLPDEIIKDTVTIGDKQYRFAGFITFGYDEATGTDTAVLKETLTIGVMPLYNSAEYWDWFVPISDGVYAAYMEYTPDNTQDLDDPQNPTDPEQPDDSQTPSSPQTGDNSNMALWFALLFISGGAVITLTVYDKKRRTANR